MKNISETLLVIHMSINLILIPILHYKISISKKLSRLTIKYLIKNKSNFGYLIIQVTLSILYLCFSGYKGLSTYHYYSLSFLFIFSTLLSIIVVMLNITKYDFDFIISNIIKNLNSTDEIITDNTEKFNIVLNNLQNADKYTFITDYFYGKNKLVEVRDERIGGVDSIDINLIDNILKDYMPIIVRIVLHVNIGSSINIYSNNPQKAIILTIYGKTINKENEIIKRLNENYEKIVLELKRCFKINKNNKSAKNFAYLQEIIEIINTVNSLDANKFIKHLSSYFNKLYNSNDSKKENGIEQKLNNLFNNIESLISSNSVDIEKYNKILRIIQIGLKFSYSLKKKSLINKANSLLFDLLIAIRSRRRLTISEIKDFYGIAFYVFTSVILEDYRNKTKGIECDDENEIINSFLFSSAIILRICLFENRNVRIIAPRYFRETYEIIINSETTMINYFAERYFILHRNVKFLEYVENNVLPLLALGNYYKSLLLFGISLNIKMNSDMKFIFSLPFFIENSQISFNYNELIILYLFFYNYPNSELCVESGSHIISNLFSDEMFFNENLVMHYWFNLFYYYYKYKGKILMVTEFFRQPNPYGFSVTGEEIKIKLYKFNSNLSKIDLDITRKIFQVEKYEVLNFIEKLKMNFNNLMTKIN